MLQVAWCAAAVSFALALPGLAFGGDFGRPSPSLPDGLIPRQFWKGPVTGYSSFPITDLEEQLRDRSYALIRPNEPRGSWNIYIAGFQLAHLFPPAIAYYDHTEYARMLLWTPSRSEASLYYRLIEDMAADGQLTGPFVAVACAVDRIAMGTAGRPGLAGPAAQAALAALAGAALDPDLVRIWAGQADRAMAAR